VHGCVLRDIAEQVNSFAPGWSLRSSFKGCVQVYASLRKTRLYRDKAEPTKDRNRMVIYIAGLTQHNANAPRDLLQIVPATAVFGALREAITLDLYDMSIWSNREGRREGIAKILSGRLSQIFRGRCWCRAQIAVADHCRLTFRWSATTVAPLQLRLVRRSQNNELPTYVDFGDCAASAHQQYCERDADFHQIKPRSWPR
jgi:hypothetical protein